jgi:predicted SnoaL-like aldol condensation-catalyzing enzyme
MSGHKTAAIDFLQMVIAGDIEKAFEKHVSMTGKHHNLFTPAGFPALCKGMSENDAQFPHKKFAIKHTLEEGDLVSVHSHLVLKPGELELVTNHLIRFEGGRIVEMWDCVQAIPAELTNKDGAF